MKLELDSYEFKSEVFQPSLTEWYEVEIVAVELRNSRVNEYAPEGGKHIHIVYEIVDGPSTGEFLYSNITLRNPANPIHENRGKLNLSAICKAIGMKKLPDNTDTLLDKAISIKARSVGAVVDWRPSQKFSTGGFVKSIFSHSK